MRMRCLPFGRGQSWPFRKSNFGDWVPCCTGSPAGKIHLLMSMLVCVPNISQKSENWIRAVVSNPEWDPVEIHKNAKRGPEISPKISAKGTHTRGCLSGIQAAADD